MSFFQISSNDHLFFNWVSVHAKTEQPLREIELQENEEKDENHRGKLYRKNPRKKVSIKSRLKTICIIGQWKSFCGQRIPESSCAGKETVDIEILITSRRKDDRKIMQPIKITSETATRMRKWNQFSQFRWTSTNVIAIEKT